MYKMSTACARGLKPTTRRYDIEGVTAYLKESRQRRKQVSSNRMTDSTIITLQLIARIFVNVNGQFVVPEYMKIFPPIPYRLESSACHKIMNLD